MDVLFSSLHYEVILLPDEQVLARGIRDETNTYPFQSGLAAGGKCSKYIFHTRYPLPLWEQQLGLRVTPNVDNIHLMYSPEGNS